jgi:hypothetical protein
MADTVQSVYQAVCDVLAEPQGLTSGIYTEAQFLEDFREVLWDLLQRTGIVKALVVEALTSGTATVSLPDHVMDVDEALCSMRYLHYTTAEEMDNLLGEWRTATGLPKRWHQDRLPQDTLGVQPTPSGDGDTVGFSAAFYGTISATSGATDLELAYSAPLYGVPSVFSGPAFVETIVPLRGTISEMVPSGANLLLVAAIKPLLRTYTLTDYIDVLPASFLPYVKYGVLARVFGRDGETRDPLRAQYCAARYQEGVNLAAAISTEALEGEE